MSEPVEQPTAMASAQAAAATPPIQMGADDSWKSKLPDEIRNDPSIKITKSVEDLAKGYIHGQKMVGSDKVVIPGKHGTPEDWDGVFNKLGRPESPDKYDFQLPEGVKKDSPFLKSFAEQAHKAGMLPQQAQKLLSWYQEESQKAVEEQQKASVKSQEESLGVLKKEWGQAYDKKLDGAMTGLKSIVDEESANQIINDPVLGNHPQFIKLLAKVGDMLSEDSIKGGEEGGPKSPKEAQSEVNRIMGDSKHAYHDRQHPSHKAAVEEVQQLFQQMSG